MQTRNIIIVTAAPTHPEVVALQATAQQRGYTVTIAGVDDSNIIDLLYQSDRRLYRVSPRTYALYKKMLSGLEGIYYDEVEAVLRGFDKAASYQLFVDYDIATPASYCIHRDETPKQYPVVVKILHGNQGKGVELVHDEASYRKFEAQYPAEATFLVQEFIEEAKAADKRLFVVGDTVVAAMVRRSTTDDFRANLHMGGVGEAYTPTDQEIQLALRTVRAFGVPYAGVDIIDSKRGPLVVEINPSPGFGVGTVTGVDIAQAIIQEVTR